MTENTMREALTLTQDEVFKLAIDAGARVIPNSNQYAVKGEITFESKYQLESLAIAIKSKLQTAIAHQNQDAVPIYQQKGVSGEWFDIQERDYKKYEPDYRYRTVYLAPPQPQEVADALEEAANICDEYANDNWALYKGHQPYKGDEDGRANPYVEGLSDGADECGTKIRALIK